MRGAHVGPKHDLSHIPRRHICAHLRAIKLCTDFIANDVIADRSADRRTNRRPNHSCPDRKPDCVSNVDTDHARTHPRRGDLFAHGRANPIAVDVDTNDKHTNGRADIEPPNHVRPDLVTHSIPDFVADKVTKCVTNDGANGVPYHKPNWSANHLRPNPGTDQDPDVSTKHARTHSTRRNLFSDSGADSCPLDLDANSIPNGVPHDVADDELADGHAYLGAIQQPNRIADTVTNHIPVHRPNSIADTVTNRGAHGQPDHLRPDSRPDEVPDVGAKHARAHPTRRDVFSDSGADPLPLDLRADDGRADKGTYQASISSPYHLCPDVVSNSVPDHGADDIGTDGVPGARTRDRV